MKKNEMNTMAKSPTPMLMIVPAAEPMIEVKVLTSSMLPRWWSSADSILKSGPRAGNVSMRNLLSSISGSSMLAPVVRRLDVSKLTMTLLMIGIMKENRERSTTSTVTIDSMDASHLGKTNFLMRIFLNVLAIGVATSENTAASSMYDITSLKYQQNAPIRAMDAAMIMYFANRSM